MHEYADDGTSHVAMLRRCASVEEAGIRNDSDALHGALCALRNDLVDHMRRERQVFDSFSPPVVAVVLAGQARLLNRIDDLLVHVDPDVGEAQCGCMAAALHLTRDLARQARLEADLLDDHRRAAR